MNTEKTPKLHLAILGVGLIGGAFGMALKDKLQDDIFITGNTRTEKSLHEAKALKAIDEGFLDPIECVQGADIIYLSTPVLQIVPLVKKNITTFKTRCNFNRCRQYKIFHCQTNHGFTS